MGTLIHRSMMFLTDKECFDSHFRNPRGCCEGWPMDFSMKAVPFPESRTQIRRYRTRLPLALDTGGGGGSLGADPQGDFNGGNAGLGRTRLGEIVSAGAREILEKLNSARKNFPTKIFLLLLGFYTANALATILGQTGDWDVLVAGIVVASIEAIGMLMYRKPSRMGMGRLKAMIVFVNYWKAGVCLGLFVDAFKLGS
ncbi:ycf20-like protein [Phalaenopsis equestris]|uniref:ycf20-like protein n=1 Tax=Phalaenopsis equestris TaxID=78828 RepID=UPI0009E585FF|nr:ycf20-like protein [Phalaenopsis equestris]